MALKFKRKSPFPEQPTVKRLRIFAGPNGSGKSTLYHEVKLYLGAKMGVWVNADEIQRELNKEFRLSFTLFELVVVEELFVHFISQLSRTFEANRFKVQNNILHVVDGAETDAYQASMIAEFIRETLLQQGKSIAFETVMSHTSKIDWMRKAQALGYRVYLYYITTDSVKIQKDRVRLRVLQNGHSVDEDKIESRYYRSLELLSVAMSVSTRAWLLDNSEVSGSMKLIAEMREDQFLELKSDFFPEWFWNYVVRKLT